jgi:hypothetical protein
MKHDICLSEELPPRIKQCCDGTSGLGSDREQKMIENFKKTLSPNLVSKGISFGKALVSHALAGFPKCSETDYHKRMEICNQCELFNREKQSCLKCGCRMLIKAEWKDAKCPLNKWPLLTVEAEPEPTQSAPESPNS